MAGAHSGPDEQQKITKQPARIENNVSRKHPDGHHITAMDQIIEKSMAAPGPLSYVRAMLQVVRFTVAFLPIQ
jgi:hypothetical protein